MRLPPAAVVLALLLAAAHVAAQVKRAADPPWQAFLTAGGPDSRQAESALEVIARDWREGHTGMIVDLARFLPSPRAGPQQEEVSRIDDGIGDPSGAIGRRDSLGGPQRLPPGADIRQRLMTFLGRRTGQRFGDDLRAWRRWMWSRTDAPHPDYASFKAELYARIDPSFRAFFPPQVPTTVRLDEIDWGGVRVNGIPPLRSPRTTSATHATWLRDGHIVFGIVIDGVARAYPRRILAWHELATDRLGGVDLTIVYCTLCGTVIPYASEAGGRRFTFGTSGLLYRSNKLMFDEETTSLWSSLDGVPVVGALAGSGLRLKVHPVVTTTWGEWKRDHPATTVLSLDTGHDRDYSEGAAYRDYFATDRLMFEVPRHDSRLKNKAEVLVLRPEVIGGGAAPVAIAVDRLRRNPVLPVEAGGRTFVVVTTAGGANLVFERGAYVFEPRLDGGMLRDSMGARWRLSAEGLVRETGERLPRVPAHRAFWFGWIAQHPATVLIR